MMQNWNAKGKLRKSTDEILTAVCVHVREQTHRLNRESAARHNIICKPAVMSPKWSTGASPDPSHYHSLTE